MSTLKELVLSAGTVTEPLDVADEVAEADVAGDDAGDDEAGVVAGVVVDDVDDDEQAAAAKTPADTRATQLTRRKCRKFPSPCERERRPSLLLLDHMPYTPLA
jgi:hypothetical protein